MPQMGDQRATLTAKLAERGLEIHSFDGHRLTLNYNPAADHLIEKGYAADAKQLADYAQSLLHGLPDAAQMFPGLDEVIVDLGAM